MVWSCYSFILLDLTLVRLIGLYEVRLYTVAGELGEPVWYVPAPGLFLGLNSFTFTKGDDFWIREDLSAVAGHFISINITVFTITVNKCPDSQPYYLKSSAECVA
mgnify:CR=1 FL=1